MLYVMLDVQTLCFQRHILGYDLARILDGQRALLRLIHP
jgi:hypothetical protein